MKALVFSDLHGMTNAAVDMLEKEQDCPLVIFLGDGVRDVEKLSKIYSDRKFIIVKGNNDFSCQQQSEAYKYIDGVTLMMCHGHLLDVKFSLRKLLNKAESVMANVALYGHTHKQNMYNDPLTGIYAINPGALCEMKYCVMTFSSGQFDIEFKSLI